MPTRLPTRPTVIVFDGRDMHVRSIRAIPADGAPISINYVSTLRPRDQRRERLLDGYNIDCECQRCLMGESEEEGALLTRLASLDEDSDGDGGGGDDGVADMESLFVTLSCAYGSEYNPLVTVFLIRRLIRLTTTNAFINSRQHDDQVVGLLSRITRLISVSYGRDSHMWSSFESLKQDLRGTGLPGIRDD